MSTIVTRAGKGSALTHTEVDANFINLNTDKIEAAQTVTLTNKTISGSNNTLSNIGNSSLTNSSVTIGSTSVSLGATATTVSGLTLSSPTITGGTVNNAVIGGVTPAAITGTTITAATSFSGALNGSVGATTPSTGAFTDLNASGDVNFTSTGAVQIPAGTTAQRPAGAAGDLRFNSSLSKFEGYNGSAWSSVGGGATGGGSDAVFHENDQVVTTNYTLTTGKNAGSFGQITINAGVTVTVPSGQTWTIV